MKKPEKKIAHSIKNTQAEWYKAMGYNQACDEWEKYHSWYIKEKCVLKEDLPSVEKIINILIDNHIYVDENSDMDKFVVIPVEKVANILFKMIKRKER